MRLEDIRTTPETAAAAPKDLQRRAATIPEGGKVLARLNEFERQRGIIRTQLGAPVRPLLECLVDPQRGKVAKAKFTTESPYLDAAEQRRTLATTPLRRTTVRTGRTRSPGRIRASPT